MSPTAATVAKPSPWLGLAAIAAATALAYGVSALIPGIGASTVGVVLGALAVNLGLVVPALRPGAKVASSRLLRIAVVLLGLQLALLQLVGIGAKGLLVVVVTVAVTFFGTQLIGRLLGMSGPRSLLVATGFSICGASAVAAMSPVADGDEDDTAVAIALVTLCGTLAIFILPAVRGLIGLGDPAAFGSWVGASVHDVGQTVATANRVDGALTSAVVVKLTRVVLLAPLVAGVALAHRRSRAAVVTTGGKRPPIVPFFVAGFLAAILITSTGLLPDGLLEVAKTAQEVLLVAALVGLGTGIQLSLLCRAGGSALAVGLTSWLLVAGVAWAGVTLLGV